MYGTLRFDSNPENEVLGVQKPVDPSSARPMIQQACQSCRGKKVKCSGERSGCKRCNALSKPCTYSSRSAKVLSRARNIARTDGVGATKSRQESGPQQQPSPQSQTQEHEQERQQEPSPKAPQDVTALAIAQATTEMDFDVESMIAWPTSDFSINDTGSSHASLLDQLPGDSSIAALSVYQDEECMATSGMSTVAEPMLNNFNASALLHSDYRSWPRASGSAHPLAITMSQVSETESMNMAKFTSAPNSIAPARNLIIPASSSTSPLEQCSCLQHVAFLVHDLETTKVESLDGQLSSHKEAVDYGRVMLMCGSCSRRPENLMSLTFLSDRLLQLSEKIVRRLANCEERPAIVFGEMEIDSVPEWELLVSSLVMQHLGALHKLMGQFKKNAETVKADIVYKKATETEKRMEDLIERLYQRFGGS